MSFVSSSPLPLTVDRRDSTPPAGQKEVDRSAQLLDQQVQDQMVQSSQRGQQYRVTAQSIRDLRQFLQAHTQLNDTQVNQVLKNYFKSGNNGAPCPGHDSHDVQRELRAEPPAVAATPRDDSSSHGNTGQETPRDSYRSTDARRTAQGDAHSGTQSPATPAPRTPATLRQPAPQVPVPPRPAPTPTTTRTATATTVTPDAPAPEAPPPFQPGQPPSPAGEPVVATGIDVPVSPEAPAPQPGVRMINYGERPPAGTDHERIPFGREQHVKFQVLTRPPTPGPVPTPQGGGEGVTLAQLLRRPGESTDSKRGRDGAEGRSGGGLDRTFAVGMRRQFRDTAC